MVLPGWFRALQGIQGLSCTGGFAYSGVNGLKELHVLKENPKQEQLPKMKGYLNINYYKLNGKLTTIYINVYKQVKKIKFKQE